MTPSGTLVVVRWRKRDQHSASETPEQTLARLQSTGQSGRPERPAMPPPVPARFPTVRLREGYEMAQVDAFLDTIETATPQQVHDKQFSTVRLREGYDMDAVDAALDEWEKRLGSIPED